MFVLNGKVLRVGKPFNHKGLQYPGDWLGQSTAAQRAEIGIVTRSTPKALSKDFDSRFWFSVDEPRDLDEVRGMFLSAENEKLGNVLSPTDWYYIRRSETGEEVPGDVADYRKLCRETKDNNYNSINGAESIEQLEAIVSELQAYPSL